MTKVILKIQIVRNDGCFLNVIQMSAQAFVKAIYIVGSAHILPC